MRITLRKAAVAATAGVMAATGLVSTAGPAQAAGPMGAANIRGTTPGNTDSMIERFCKQGPATHYHFGAYNVRTGEFRTENEYLGKISTVKAPRGDWEVFSGRCYYPQASTWTFTGKEERISRWIENRGRTGEDKETFVRGYSTKTSSTKSVGGSLDLGLAKSIFTGSLGGNFSYQWGWERTASFERRSEKSIPACTRMALTWRPFKRVVRVNPVIDILAYAWRGSNGKVTSVDTWRGKGRGWDKIYSYGYYIDGTSDQVVRTNGNHWEPDGIESKVLQRLDRRKCT
ncbi:hypothetical protein [Streptomyces sp. TRM64462]|uniref:hypothetical protein n=1 Tax=Streptomyces sp. TRM64462 TaxID=2741726 RepID=UPI0028156BE0|nr:hypothetical protein [Streptomyces sp. TRM64462]